MQIETLERQIETPDDRSSGMVAYLSLGAGVQSTAALLLAIDGRLPKYEAAIFADTRDEPAAVYEHLDKLRPVAQAAGIPVITVSAGRLSDTSGSTFVPIPLYDGHGSMGRRQCTYQFKLRPIRQYLHDRHEAVELAVCISTDEIARAKDSNVKWCRNVFPLLDLMWSRDACKQYLADRWPWPVPRSACVYCPFKSDREFLDLRENHPDDWAAAVAFDEAVRPFGYVHRSEKPLATAVLIPEDAGQLAFDIECEGMCGI